MIISRTFVLPAIMLIVFCNCIHGKNPKTVDQSAIVYDEIENMFQNIKSNVSDVQNKTLLILKCISDSNLNQAFFKTSMQNYEQLIVNNNHNSPSLTIDLSDLKNLSELKKIVGELYRTIKKQGRELRENSSLFLNHGIQINQTDIDIMSQSCILTQVYSDCNQCEKHLSKKHPDNTHKTDTNI